MLPCDIAANRIGLLVAMYESSKFADTSTKKIVPMYLMITINRIALYGICIQMPALSKLKIDKCTTTKRTNQLNQKNQERDSERRAPLTIKELNQPAAAIEYPVDECGKRDQYEYLSNFKLR
jgi:hypothetical protein